MIFNKSVVLASLVASVSAISFVPNDGIEADSRIGHRLMSKARAVEQGGSYTWLAGYKIKYLGCSSLVQVNAEENGGQQQQDGSLLYTMNLVKFGLCKSETTCSSCGNGVAQYVVPMNDFVDAWTEAKMEADQYACEMIRENCYCENANDDNACEASCYTAAGMDTCVEYQDDEEFEVQRFMECGEMEQKNNNNNNNNNKNGNYNYNYQNSNNGIDMYAQYYTGLHCSSNGWTINTAVFKDSGCTTKATAGTWSAFNYGASLPYETKSLVDPSECMSCMESNNNNNNNGQNNNNNNNGNYYYQNAQVTELCSETYQRAAKCETNLNTGSSYFYPDTSGCDYIKNILPKLAAAGKSVTYSSAASVAGGSAAVAFAVIFFLTSVILGAYSFFLYRKIHRAKVNLAQSEGMMMT